MAVAFIGLGSNLQDPAQQLNQARRALADLPDTDILADSGIFKSVAMTMPGDDEPQPDYLNAVVKLRTGMSADDLLDALQAIENVQGRVRTKTWGARTLDLDILMYDDLQRHDQRLCIPHPGIAERDFVLYPLRAIDPALSIPGVGTVEQLIERLPNSRIEYLGPFHE